MTAIYSFSLDEKNDAAVKRWLDSLPKRQRSREICEILAAHINGQVTLLEIYHKLTVIEQKIGNGIIMTGGKEEARMIDEPPDVAANIDGLGK